jgi:hypothetical protein
VDENPPRCIDFTVSYPSRLENYKKQYEEALQVDLFARRLVFQFNGKPIHYISDIPDLEAKNPIEVRYEEYENV